MSTNRTRRQQIVTSLNEKEYRDAFVASHIRNGLAFQIRAMQQAHGWSQRDLGERVGMKQETISHLQNPHYGKYTLRTLLRLASAFDVALIVKFAPFSELVDWACEVPYRDLQVPDFEHDNDLGESTVTDTASLVTLTRAASLDNG